MGLTVKDFILVQIVDIAFVGDFFSPKCYKCLSLSNLHVFLCYGNKIRFLSDLFDPKGEGKHSPSLCPIPVTCVCI